MRHARFVSLQSFKDSLCYRIAAIAGGLAILNIYSVVVVVTRLRFKHRSTPFTLNYVAL